MEQSAQNLSETSPKPDDGISTIDTPRTSNLKFLRAKRLSYFCGKSSQSLLSNSGETQCVGAHKKHQATRRQTPRRCLSAPTSKQQQLVSVACSVQKRGNVRANISSHHEGTNLQAAEDAMTLESATHQILQGNPEKERSTPPPSHHSLRLSPNEMETKDPTNCNNLQQAPEKSNPQEPFPKYSLQPAPEENTKDTLIHHSLQPPLEKAGNKSLSTDHNIQPAQKDAKIKESPTCHNPQSTPEEPRAKDHLTYSHPKPEPEDGEISVPSTHRNLLRSSFVSDLDQDLLEDLSVPETEKLQHVMTWAKKFLSKCNGGGTLPFSEADDILPNNMDERITTDNYFKLNTAPSDRSAPYDVYVDSDEYEFTKQPYLNDQYKESTPRKFWVPVSPRKMSKAKSVFNQISHAAAEPDPFLSKRPVSTLSHSNHKGNEDNFTKPLLNKYPQTGTDGLGKDTFRNKSYTRQTEQFDCEEPGCDDEDLFGDRLKSNQWDYNTHVNKGSESDRALKDNFVDKDDTSLTESSLDTERLNALLEELEIIHKDSEKKRKSVEKDGARTNRTYLVEKCAESEDNTAISVSKKILDWSHTHSYRAYPKKNVSEDSTLKIYQVCPVCSFSNTTKTSWCAECGSVLKSDKGHTENKSTISHEDMLEDFFSVKKDIAKGLVSNHVSTQNDKECRRTVCWEDNSDVVSDSDGSVLEKYLFYVKQLDIISQEKKKQSKYVQDKQTGEMSSEDESSEEYLKPQINSGTVKHRVTYAHATNDYDEVATQFLEAPNDLVKSELCHFNQEARLENHLVESSEKNIGTEVYRFKGPLDRKLQKTTHISSKVTGPRRYWEKSSIAWSSYTHGEMKPRSQDGIQRPASAEPRKKNNQYQDDNAPDLHISKNIARHIQRPTSSLTKATEYKSVAVAYMKTANAWAVSEHLSQSYSDGPSHNLQWVSGGDYGSMWLLLPDELWIYIFALLSHKDLSQVTQVCQRFRYIANDDSLWKVIKITNCHSLNDTCLVNIGLHHPESLSLYRCHDDTQSITEAGLGKLFQHCKASLTELNITNCSGQRFEGDTVLSCAGNYCTQLTSVDISWTAATDKGIIALVEASARLQSLSMNGCKITDHAITGLLKKHCKSLIKIEVFGCHALTAKCLISVATECAHLENLNIGRIPKATDVCLAKIASNLHNITTLNLTGLNVVRDRAVHHIVKQCSKLENLTLSSCSQVTDVSLVEISTYLSTIKYLDLSGCKKVSDIGIQALARSCQQICYLDLSSTGTGKRGVCLLASYCYATLECLKLSFCKEVTSDSIEKLCKNCKRLKILHLYGCRVSPDLEYIKEFSKSFQIFHDLSIPTAKILGE